MAAASWTEMRRSLIGTLSTTLPPPWSSAWYFSTHWDAPVSSVSWSTIGVLFPPIEAGSVGEGLSMSIGRPWPLKSIPANGEGRSTGFFAVVTFALQVWSLPGSPRGGSPRRASTTLSHFLTVGLG